jgi:sugar/nucleoside kinase (ribokinase family)
MRVCCLGDLVLDVIVRLEQPLARGGDATSRITLSPGGQAANVAAWVAALDGDGVWLGKRADDAPGRIAAEGLLGLGVELRGPVAQTGNGVIVSLVEPGGERTMCPDRGVATDLAPEELDLEQLTGCDWLHVSGYALFADPVRAAAFRAVELAREAGARVSLDLASWTVIRDRGGAAARADVTALSPDVVFGNQEESSILGGPLPGIIWILKRGAAGCSFAGDERDALPVSEVIDTTGAGDALAAGWLVGGPESALQAAARCVQAAGAMPDQT